MVSSTTRDLRSSDAAGQVTLGISILAALSLAATDLRIRIDLTPGEGVFLVGYVFLVVYFRFGRPNVAAARMLIAFGQLFVVILMGVMLSYAASTVPLPFRDAELLAIDHWLGFERSAYQAFLATHETLRDILSFSYGTMNQQDLLVAAVAVAMRKPEVLQTYVIAFAIAVTATAAIAIFVPAANALIYVDKLPTDIVDLPNGGRSYFQALQGLRTGTLRIVDLGALDGLISFPSFHTASAILFVWVLWSTPIVRFVILPLNVLLIAGTPLCGAHYLADIVGGAAVALGAIFVTSRLMDVKPRRAEAAFSGPLEQVDVLVVRGARGAGSGEGAESRRSMSTERV